MKPILVAPLAIVALYFLMATLAFLHAPSWDATWVYWAAGQVAGVAYIVALPAGMLLEMLYRAVGGPPRWACFAVGLVASIGTAVVFDLPEPDFGRLRYYGFAALAGVLWAVAFDKLSKAERGKDA